MMSKQENSMKQGKTKAEQSFARLLLLAACTRTQENRFDIPEGKKYKSKRPSHVKN